MNHTKQIIAKYKAEKRARKIKKVVKILKVIFWIFLALALYAIASNGTYPY